MIYMLYVLLFLWAVAGVFSWKMEDKVMGCNWRTRPVPCRYPIEQVLSS
jgi:hypothetical protein